MDQRLHGDILAAAADHLGDQRALLDPIAAGARADRMDDAVAGRIDRAGGGACLERAQLDRGDAVGRLQLPDAGATPERASLGQNPYASGAAPGTGPSWAPLSGTRAPVPH